MKNFNINFGGFCDSLHSACIDNLIEQELEEDDSLDCDSINYNKLRQVYCIKYLEVLEQVIKNEYDLLIEIKFNKIISPREYNFETDTIHAGINNLHCAELTRIFLNNNEFIEYVNTHSKSYSGFYSFYEGIEVVKKELSILLQYIFKFIISENEEELNYIEVSEELINSIWE